jgi:predicted metal-dependent enzyme (double-stranded beta helix superfamily)
MALQTFIQQMDRMVADEPAGTVAAAATAEYLSRLLADPDCLDPRHREPDPRSFRRHVVHVHPGGRYSVMSLVWLPGQETPIHDHLSWCVVGVLRGQEQETRYHLNRDGEEEWLTVAGGSVYDPGSVTYLVPPEENIHRVRNVTDDIAISIHVYGLDITQGGGSSINRIFDLEVRDRVPALAGGASGGPVSWRG